MRGIVSFKNSLGNCGNKIEKNIHISEEEEQTLYYVGGFIVFSMRRKYEKILKENPKSISASNALILLKSVNNEGGKKIQEHFFNELIKSGQTRSTAED